MAKKVGNSSWLADLVTFIKGKVTEAHGEAATAQQTADKARQEAATAQQTADMARQEAAAKAMAREFEASPNATTYTTTGSSAKFYNVSVWIVGVMLVPVTIDYRVLLKSDQGYDFRIATTDGGFVYLHATRNSDKTVTFTVGTTDSDLSPEILHIAGYY